MRAAHRGGNETKCNELDVTFRESPRSPTSIRSRQNASYTGDLGRPSGRVDGGPSRALTPRIVRYLASVTTHRPVRRANTCGCGSRRGTGVELVVHVRRDRPDVAIID